MLRFLFLNLVCVFFAISTLAEIESAKVENTFSEKHIKPVLEKGSDLHSGITFLSGAFASALTRGSDDHIRGQWMDHQKISKKDSLAGDLIGTGAASLIVAGSQYLFDSNESRYQSQLRGFIYGGISIYVLKTTFGRNRPGLSNSHQSFPSGHTAITFMTATQLVMAYGWKAAVIAIPVAMFTATTRLSDDAHWFSDTVGGAFLGYLVGRATFYDSNEYSVNAGLSGAGSTHRNVKKFSVQTYPTFRSEAVGFVTLVSF